MSAERKHEFWPADEGVYNTYVLDCKDAWAVLLHCAEKPSGPRYLSAILLSRDRTVPDDVHGYVRDKLPKYGVQPEYTFPMVQDQCSPTVQPLFYAAADKRPAAKRRPMALPHAGSDGRQIETDGAVALEDRRTD